MPDNFFHQEGDRLDYTPEAATAAGTVVTLGSITGIVTTDLEAGQKGSLTIEGVVKFLKTASEAIDAGDEVYWVSGAATAGGGAGPGLGVAAYDAAAADTHVFVKLIPGMAAQGA